jgi:hypothetical protein
MREELRRAELVDEEPARPQDACDLLQRAVRVRDVIRRAEVHDDVELAIGERKASHVRADELGVRTGGGEALGGRAESTLVHVDADEPRGRAEARQRRERDARAAADLEDAAAARHVEQADKCGYFEPLLDDVLGREVAKGTVFTHSSHAMIIARVL